MLKKTKVVRMVRESSLGCVNSDELFVGIDLGLGVTGVGAVGRGKIQGWNIIPEKDQKGPYRLKVIQDSIGDLLDRLSPVRVVTIEGYAYGAMFGKGRGRVFDIGELGGVVRLLLVDREHHTVIVPPTCLKKFFTSHGRAEKHELRLHLMCTYGIMPKTLDESDAIGLGIMGYYFKNRNQEWVKNFLKPWQLKILEKCDVVC